MGGWVGGWVNDNWNIIDHTLALVRPGRGDGVVGEKSCGRPF